MSFAIAAWHLWTIAGIALLALEALSPAFIFASLGAAAFIAASFAFYGFGLTAQLVVFAIASVALMLLARPIARRYFGRADRDVLEFHDSLPGLTGTVTRRITQETAGSVNVAGSTWTAVTDRADVLEPGARIVVAARNANTLIVRKGTPE